MNPLAPQPFLNLREVSEALRLPAAWLRREAVMGRIPSVLAGGRRLFDADAVRRAVSATGSKASDAGGEVKQ